MFKSLLQLSSDSVVQKCQRLKSSARQPDSDFTGNIIISAHKRPIDRLESSSDL